MDVDGIVEEDEVEEENENKDNKERLFLHLMTSALLCGVAG